MRNLIINEEGIVRFQLEEIFVACEDFVTETKRGLELRLSLDKAPEYEYRGIQVWDEYMNNLKDLVSQAEEMIRKK